MKSTLNIPLPMRARKGDAGYDFFLPCSLTLKKGQRVMVDTGIIMEEGDIPEGYVMLLFPRSSSGSEYGLALANSVGVIDSHYRDTIKAKLWLNDPSVDGLRMSEGFRFMQGVLVPYGIIPSEIPPEEERNGGFGSTGA